MRILTLLVITAACTGAPRPAPVAPVTPCPTVAATPAVAPVPAAALAPDLDEAAVKDKSHAFFDAFDRNSIQEFRDSVGPTFALVEAGRTYAADLLAKTMQAATDRHDPIQARTWKRERVFTHGGTAVFVGLATIHYPAREDRPASEDDEWDTLVWVRDGALWQVAHLQAQPGGMEAERALWNGTYHASVEFNHKPNQLLVDTIKGRKPGTALDVAMGQGRNALYLASQGWKTTGIDISDEGIKIAKDTAAKQKLKLDVVQADDNTYDFGKARWDLVTFIYAGSDETKIKKIQASLKKGGLFVCEFFHKDAVAGTGIGSFSEGQLAALFKDGFKIVRDEVVVDVSDWLLHKTKLVRFVAQKL